jgi:hypothetical protein
LVVALTGLIAWWASPAPIEAPWDVFTLLNGGYRMLEGQAQGIDFTNPIGPLVYGLVAVGMRVQSQPSLEAVTYGTLIFLVMVSALAWAVTRRRLPQPYAAAFTCFVAILSVSVRPLGYAPSTTTYAMLYNRYAWLLYSILLLLVLVRRRGPQTNLTVTVDGALLGVVLGLIFYCKITFFVAGVLAVGLGLVLRTLPCRWRLGAGAASGFIAVAATMRAAFGVRTIRYVRDFLDAGRVQVGSQRTHALASGIFHTAPVTFLALCLLVLLVENARRSGEPVQPLILLGLTGAFILISSLMLSAGDAPERGELPALVVVPLLVVVFLERALPRWAGGSSASGRRPSRAWPWALASLALLLVATSGPIVGKDVLAMKKSISYRDYVSAPPSSQVMEGRGLRDFVIPATGQWQTAYRSAHNIPEMINDGEGLLRRNIHPGDKVYTAAYTDPFSFALGLHPVAGGPLWWDLGFDFDRDAHPPAEQFLGTADWVLVPRMVAGQGCCQETVKVLLETYAGYLNEHFRRVDQTDDWTLLRRVQ